MNQIFRITVGQDTLQGRLPAVRIGMGYCARFLVFGVAYGVDVEPPKIWVTTASDPLYWTGVWSAAYGAWLIDVNEEASAAVAAKTYALTVSSSAVGKEYLVGQAAFSVYATIAGAGISGGTGGTSLVARVDALETWMETFADLAMFDPETATDFEMRTQLRTITNRLRGTE